MEQSSFILGFIQGIAWPLVIMVLFLYYGKVLKEILILLKNRIKEKGLEIENSSIGEVKIPGDRKNPRKSQTKKKRSS